MTGNRVNTSLHRTWRLGLVVVVALAYAWIGLSADGLDRFVGLGGAVLIVAALVLPRRARLVAIALLLIGTIPLAVLTWWSLVTPLLAVLCLLLGWPRTTPTTPATPSLPPMRAYR